ncbi:MAG: CHASE2 domain-containing protein, partial [Duncaniella sp.]|nr:CHASE2 domain-containing protein [Duncaniella sp.]
SFPPRRVMSYQREMFLKAPLLDGDSIESFALTLALMKKPDLKLPSDRSIQSINFNISEVEVIDFDEFNDPETESTVGSLIKGRIVLIGDVHNKYDIHPTAIDEEMPGIIVHAAAISTLLNEKPVKPLGRVWSILFIVVCVAIVTIADAYYTTKDDFRKGLGFLGIKGFILILMLFGGYALYIHFGIRSDFTYTITLFMFSLLIADLWFGFRTFLAEKNDKKKRQPL